MGPNQALQPEHWRSKRGFLLATIGSAVGIGNIWRFSYIAGENGGGAFLVMYVFCILLLSIPIIVAELSLGRRGQGGVLAAFQSAAPGSIWGKLGWLGLVGAVLILSFYAVIAGWALKYLTGTLLGSLWGLESHGYGGYFAAFIANNGEPVVWQGAMLVATMFVVAGGVRRGIESTNQILMPLLALIVISLAAYSATLPGAAAGWKFLFSPNWSALLRPDVFSAALGQAFFSTGVGMSVYITYGSYLPRSIPIPASAGTIALADTLFAVVAGLAIFPAVFAFGIDPKAGPELAFVTLPQLFLSMPGGKIVGTVFFFLLTAAALTSMVSLLEVPVASLIHQRGWHRQTAVAFTGALAFAIGIPAALSFGVLADVRLNGLGVLDAIDHAVSQFLLPLAGLGVALFVGWRWGRTNALVESELSERLLGIVWIWLIRVVAPAMILVILFRSVDPF